MAKINNYGLTAQNLSNELWEVLKDARSRKIKPNEANAVTQAARTICSVAKLELQYATLLSKKHVIKPGSVALLERK